MTLPPLLDELLRAPGPTGAEDAVAAIVRREVSAFAELESDALGSTLATVRGAGGGPRLALYAHVDQIGMAVTHVGDDGMLSVHRLGVWRARAALGQRVTVLGRGGRVPGVVVSRTAGGKPSWESLVVDVGAADAAEAGSLVAPGDPVVLAAPPLEVAGGRVVSGALDNRASVYVALEALRELAAEPPPGDVTLAASVQEEGSHAGAAAATERLRPDVALVLDITYAADAPGTDPRESGLHRLGGGPALFRGPAVHPRVLALLVEAAEAEGMPFSVETGHTTHTDADDVYGAAGGTAVGLASIPMRYAHTAVEMVQLSDLELVTRLVVAFARRLPAGVDFAR